MVTILAAEFDTTDDLATIISGTTGKKINIVGIHVTLNEDDSPTEFRLADFWFSSPVVHLNMSATHGLYMRGRQTWGLQISYDSIKHPYWTSASGNGLFFTAGGNKRFSGVVWYYLTDA